MTSEQLWAAFQWLLATGRCPCGCSFEHSRWEYHDNPARWDDEVAEHLGMGRVDEPCSRLENHWRHFQRWGHDGRNPLGGRGVALPTWLARKAPRQLTLFPTRPPRVA